MESKFFARTCKILALLCLILTVVDFKLNFFGLHWHYYVVRAAFIGTLITLSLKSRNKETIPLYYFDIYAYTLFALPLYGMIFVAPAYVFCFMQVFIAIGITSHTTVKRFITQSVVGFAASAIAHYFTPTPRIVAEGVNFKPLIFFSTTVFQIIAGCLYLFVTRFRHRINELNEKYAYIGKRSSFLIHEIKTPLNRIISQTSETDSPVLNNINAESKRILSIIESVEALIYRPDEIAKTFETFSLNEIKDRVKSDFESFLNAYNIDLKFDNSDVTLLGNKSLIYQLFKNIIDNAVEAIGYRENERPLIHIKAENASEYLVIRILNTHSSMPKSILKKTFLPHFTTKNKPSNKGLGLPLSKCIVEAHRGRILAHSDQAKNITEFEIQIPLTAKNVQA